MNDNVGVKTPEQFGNYLIFSEKSKNTVDKYIHKLVIAVDYIKKEHKVKPTVKNGRLFIYYPILKKKQCKNNECG